MKTKLYALQLFITCLCYPLFSQTNCDTVDTKTFSTTFHADTSDQRLDYAVSGVQNTAGNYAVLGFRQHTIGNSDKYLLTYSELNPAGNLITSSVVLNLDISGSPLAIADNFSNAKIIETKDAMGIPDGYVITAPLLNAGGLRDALLAKLSLTGCVVWANTFSELAGLNNVPIGLFQEPSGELLLFAQVNTSANTGYTALLIVAPDGTNCSHYDYQNVNNNNQHTFVPTTVGRFVNGSPENARFVVAGEVFGNSTGVFYLDNFYLPIFNIFSFYNLDGGTGTKEPIHSVVQDGTYTVLCGGSGSEAVLAKVEPYPSNGALIWSKKYNVHGLPSPLSPQLFATSVEVLSSGDYVATGYADALNLTGISKGFQLKTNNNGNSLALRHYGDAPTLFFDQMKTTDGGLLMLGGNYTGNDFTRSEQLAVKTDGLGKLANCDCYTNKIDTVITLPGELIENDYMERLETTCMPVAVNNICSGLPPTQGFCDQFSPADSSCVASFAVATGDCGMVAFADLSTVSGTPTWLWTFPGGTPSTSTDQNPVVSYPTSGSYTACLTIDNGLMECSYCDTFNLVYDDEPPICSLPAPLVLSTEAGICHNNTNIALNIPTDNCDTHPDLACVRSDGLNMTDPFLKGLTTFYCTATDASGNSSTCSTTVTVNDTEPATAVCVSSINAVLDASCNASILPSDVDGGSIDNCLIVSMTLSQSTFSTCGNFPVTLTVTDCGGNISQCATDVVVQDLMSPVITCPTIPPIATAICPVAVNGLNYLTIGDNCPGAFVSGYVITGATTGTGIGDASGTAFNNGNSTVTYSIIDGCGNIGQCLIAVDVVCDTGCCSDYQAFCDKFEDGFSVQRFDCGIQLTPRSLDDCQQVFVTWGDGQVTGPHLGGGIIPHLYSASGDFQICAEVQELDNSGMVCFQKDTCWMVCVRCDTCSNPLISIKSYESGGDSDYNGGHNSSLYVTSDDLGNFYATGSFTGSYGSLNSAGEHDVFVRKFDNNIGLLWEFGFGGTLQEEGTIIKADKTDGSFYVTGSFYNTDLTIPSFGGGGTSKTLLNASNEDGFVAKFDSNKDLVWAFNLQSNFNVQLEDLEIDYSGNIVITGLFNQNINVDPDFSNTTLASSGQNFFVAKYASSNGQLMWAKTWQGIGGGFGLGVSTDPFTGDIYATGKFSGEVDIDGDGVIDLTQLLGFPIPFVVKYDQSGAFLWAFKITNSIDYCCNNSWDTEAYNDGTDSGFYITGEIKNGPFNFDPIGGNAAFTAFPQSCITYLPFLAKYDKDGLALCVQSLPCETGPREITMATNGHVYLTGYRYGQPSNMFIGIYDENCQLLKSTEPNSLSGCAMGWSIAPDPFGDFTMIGRITGPNGFDADPDENDGLETTSNGSCTIGGAGYNTDQFADIFIGKYTCICPPDSLETEEGCCDSLIIMATKLPTDSWRYTFGLINKVGFDITQLEAALLGSDWSFANVNEALGFSTTSSSNNIVLSYSPVIPSGTTNNALYFCLNPLTSTATSPQTIVFNWYETLADGTEHVVCRDTIYTECAPPPPMCSCGTYDLNFIQNGITYPITCGDPPAPPTCTPSDVLLAGSFACDGGIAACPPSDVNWQLYGPFGMISNGIEPANAFSISIPAAQVSDVGQYFFVLKSYCLGVSDSCLCVIRWEQLDCDTCKVESFNTTTGFDYFTDVLYSPTSVLDNYWVEAAGNNFFTRPNVFGHPAVPGSNWISTATCEGYKSYDLQFKFCLADSFNCEELFFDLDIKAKYISEIRINGQPVFPSLLFSATGFLSTQNWTWTPTTADCPIFKPGTNVLTVHLINNTCKTLAGFAPVGASLSIHGTISSTGPVPIVCQENCCDPIPDSCTCEELNQLALDFTLNKIVQSTPFCNRWARGKGLHTCDQVQWELNGTVVATSTGNDWVNIIFNSGANTLCMIVTRTTTTGIVCAERTVCKSWSFQCTPFSNCASDVIVNGGFAEGQRGYFGEDGSADPWQKAFGFPFLSDEPGAVDENQVILSGNSEESDGIQQKFDCDFGKTYELSFYETPFFPLPPNTETRIIVRLSDQPQSSINCVGNCQDFALTSAWSPQNGCDTLIWRTVSWQALESCADSSFLLFFVENDLPNDSFGLNRSYLAIDNICVDKISATKEEVQKINASVFPNPTTDELTLRFSGLMPNDGKIQLLDLWGRTVHEAALLPGKQDHNISISTLPAGVYFIQIMEEGMPVWVEKVVKQ